MFNIKGKVAVITGGYGVLGASMARCLAEQGVHVAIVGRKPEKGEPLATELSAIGAEAIFCQADVLDRDALVAAREADPGIEIPHCGAGAHSRHNLHPADPLPQGAADPDRE